MLVVKPFNLAQKQLCVPRDSREAAELCRAARLHPPPHPTGNPHQAALSCSRTRLRTQEACQTLAGLPWAGEPKGEEGKKKALAAPCSWGISLRANSPSSPCRKRAEETGTSFHCSKTHCMKACESWAVVQAAVPEPLSNTPRSQPQPLSQVGVCIQPGSWDVTQITALAKHLKPHTKWFAEGKALAGSKTPPIGTCPATAPACTLKCSTDPISQLTHLLWTSSGS